MESKNDNVKSLYDALIKKYEQVSGNKFDPQENRDFDIRKERAREARLAAQEIRQEQARHKQQAIDDLHSSGLVDARYTFDTIKTDEHNKDAVDSSRLFCLTALENPEEVPLLFIQGAEGSGKTVLCNAIANLWAEKCNSSVLIASFEEIRKTRLFTAGEERSESAGRDETWDMYCTKNLLIIDGFLKSREGLSIFDQQLFGQLLRKRHENRLPTVITTPVSFNSLHQCVGDFCFESFREYNVMAKSLYGGSRRKAFTVNGRVIT